MCGFQGLIQLWKGRQGLSWLILSVEGFLNLKKAKPTWSWAKPHHFLGLVEGRSFMNITRTISLSHLFGLNSSSVSNAPHCVIYEIRVDTRSMDRSWCVCVCFLDWGTTWVSRPGLNTGRHKRRPKLKNTKTSTSASLHSLTSSSTWDAQHKDPNHV